MPNISNNIPEDLRCQIWNDLFLDGHHTHVTTEKNTNTIVNEIVTWINLVNLY